LLYAKDWRKGRVLNSRGEIISGDKVKGGGEKIINPSKCQASHRRLKGIRSLVRKKRDCHCQATGIGVRKKTLCKNPRKSGIKGHFPVRGKLRKGLGGRIDANTNGRRTPVRGTKKTERNCLLPDILSKNQHKKKRAKKRKSTLLLEERLGQGGLRFSKFLGPETWRGGQERNIRPQQKKRESRGTKRAR